MLLFVRLEGDCVNVFCRLDLRPRHFYLVRHFQETDRDQGEEVWSHRRKHTAAGNLRTVLALRNMHRTVPRVLPQ